MKTIKEGQTVLVSIEEPDGYTDWLYGAINGRTGTVKKVRDDAATRWLNFGHPSALVDFGADVFVDGRTEPLGCWNIAFNDLREVPGSN